MRNYELEDTLAFLELLSSVLTIQLIMESRFGTDRDSFSSDSFLAEDYRGGEHAEERLVLMERRISRLENRLGIR